MTLNFDVAERQMFGTAYSRKAVDGLLAGRMTMTPHPEWELPETIDWAADPFEDINWQNQYHMLRWLDPLRRAAYDGDADALAMWLRYVRDWVRSNPRSAPAHRWVWRDMVEGIRVIQLCLAAPLLRDHSPEDLGWLEDTIRDHADFMADPQNLGKANHAMHQHEALFVCARMLGDEDLAALATRRLDQLLSEEYDEQGVNGEGAVAYHYNNFVWWERALRRFDAEGVKRPAAAARHQMAPEEIAHATRPDGTFVAIGDTDGGTPRTMTSPLTDYVMSRGAEGEAPSDLLKVYDAGYLFARSGWGETERNIDEETFFSVSFGPSDRVHGHPDGGSVTYSSDTVNWLVDPGKYQYGYSIPRKHFVSRAAHNLVSIEGRTPRKSARVSLERRSVSERGYDFLFSDDSFEDITLTRRVIYSVSGEYLVVIDQVRSRTECTGIQRWQLGPDVKARVAGQHVSLWADKHKGALKFIGTRATLDTVRGQTTPFDGWVATGWKKKEAATAVLASKTGTNFRFITVVATGGAEFPDAVNIPVDGSRLCLNVRTNKGSELVLIERETVSFPTEIPGDVSEVGARPKVADVAKTKTGRPHHLDSTSRAEIFARIETARESAWSEDGAGRAQSAARLQSEISLRGLTEDVDLGLQAGITDLLQTERGREDPKAVDPQRTALANWDNAASWRPAFYPMDVRSHRSEFTLSERPSAAEIHTVPAGPLLLPFALDPSPGETLTVIFQGAVDRAKVRVPIFTRLRYQVLLGAGPSIAFADPTLDLSTSLRLGWYLGTESVDLAAVIAKTIEQVKQTLGAKNVVLAGSSGGGFAALQVAANLPGAVVVAMSPQTDLRRYAARLVTAATIPAFGMKAAPTSGPLSRRVSAIERMESLSRYPRTVLVSNTGDLIHVKNHEAPLLEAYSAAGHGDSIQKIDLDLGPGHRAVGNEEYGRIMKDLYASL